MMKYMLKTEMIAPLFATTTTTHTTHTQKTITFLTGRLVTNLIPEISGFRLLYG